MSKAIGPLSVNTTGAPPAPGCMLDVDGAVCATTFEVNGSPLAIQDIADDILVDIDFASLPTNTFTDGLENIDGVNWTVANTAATNTFEIQNGVGLRFNANTTNTVYDATSRTAANLSVPILSLIAGFDPLRTYVIDVFLSSVTLGASGNRVEAGFLLDTGGTDRLIAGGRRNTAGNQQVFSQTDGTVNGDASTDDAFVVRCDNRGVSTFSGTYAGDFPTYIHGGGSLAVPNSFNGPLDPTQGQVVLAWPTGEAGGAMDITIERLRIRRIA